MLPTILSPIQRLWSRWLRTRAAAQPSVPPTAPPQSRYQQLQRVLLTEGVQRTLFADYAAHRATARGEEETGWLLLGLREGDTATALATLPAGTQRDASAVHVRFNRVAQALGHRIVRQWERRLTLLGVVHTHPGSLRHPSDGDFQGDRVWVERLAGREGVFGIGTADARAEPATPHRQCQGELLFSWFALAADERSYRQLPVELTAGDNLAEPLLPVWPLLEAHADALERLALQQARVTFQIDSQTELATLLVSLKLADPETSLHVHLSDNAVRYYWDQGGAPCEIAPQGEQIDRNVYLILAELAHQAGCATTVA